MTAAEAPLYARLQCWTGPALLEHDFPPLIWVVPGLIPAGLSLLVGAPKVGKSWAALDIALAVASGGQALGGIPVDPGDVLLLALEDGPRRIAERMRLLLGNNDASPRLHAYVDWPRDVAARAAWQWCRDHPGVRLVVVDTLARVRPPREKGGNSYDQDTDALVPWQKLAEHFKVAVVLVHHDRKAADANDFIDNVSGTHGLAGVADTTLILDRDRMQDHGRLRLTGRDVHEREIALVRAGPAWVITDGPPRDPNLGDDSTRILTWLAQHEHAAGPTEVADALDLNVANVKVTLGRLAHSGRLAKDGRGLYRPPITTVTSVPFPPLPSNTGNGSNRGTKRQDPDGTPP